jgi:hypothetical protein
VTDDELQALRQRLVALRDDLLERLSQEFGVGEAGLTPGVMTAIVAIDEKRLRLSRRLDGGWGSRCADAADLGSV